MKGKLVRWASEESRMLLEFKESSKPWHSALIAAACAGIPLFCGYFMQQPTAGILACTGGLVILYLPEGSFATRLITLLICSAGFILSFAAGLFLDFSVLLSSFALSLFAFGANLLTNYFRVKAPGSYLFVMLTAIAIYMPHEGDMTRRLGLLTAGCLLACVLAAIYLLIFYKTISFTSVITEPRKSMARNFAESGMLALFVGLSLNFASLFHLQKPYWITISCAAVMQGTDVRHVWQRSFQRTLGTMAGLALAWLLLTFHFGLVSIFIAITLLQFAASLFSSRHYALVVICFTPVAIFLAEAGSMMQVDANKLILARLLDTLIGCTLGAIGGWLLHLQLRKKGEVKKEKIIVLEDQRIRSK